MTQTVPRHDWADASSGRVNSVLAPTRMHLANAVKTVAYRTGLHRTLFYRYDYMFRPRDLALLVTFLTETSGLPGPIFEIGCAAGHTTVFLNKHLDDLDDARRYVCLDTFAGFTQADIDVEVERGHETSQYEYVFRAYRKEWFDQTMTNNHIDRVNSIQADVNTFDFSPYRDISFCLIDVDLLRPVTRALEGVHPRMAPGGIIVVDDCTPGVKYEGAYTAYMDFVERIGAPVDIRHDVLGIIEVPR
jgi:O-methyltransferase